MMWRALQRLVAVRLLLLVAIASAGPAGVASSWHAAGSVEHRLSVQADLTRPASLEAGALPSRLATHCAACQFGATLRAWTPAPSPSSLVPASCAAAPTAPFDAALHVRPADAHAGRGPPLAA